MNIHDLWKNDNKHLAELAEAMVKDTTKAYSVKVAGWVMDENTFKHFTDQESIEGSNQRVICDVFINDGVRCDVYIVSDFRALRDDGSGVYAHDDALNGYGLFGESDALAGFLACF